MTVIKKVLIFIPLYCVWVVAALNFNIGVLCPVCATTDGFEWVAIGLYLVLIMVPMALFIWWVVAPPGWVKKVEANGQSAPATILSVKNTGVVINNTIAVVKLQLRVEPPNAAPFEVSVDKEISMITGLGGYAAGGRVMVKYDPANHNHLVIVGEPDTPADSHGAASNYRSDVTDKLAELSRLHKSGELTEAEYAAAKKKLLG